MMKFEYRDSRMLRVREFFGNSSAFILLAGLAVASLWLLVAPTVLGSSSASAPEPLVLADSGVVSQSPLDDLLPGMRLLDDFQVSTTRDPFRPLITEATDGTGDGGDGFDPTGTTVSLISITNVGGTRQAVVRVAGTDYTVGPGETFAGSYQVVTLTDTAGTFLFGDSPFTLAVGEEILK